ncbi:hypothetical protein EZV62_004064 [Acer yangbiense]|uniref:Transposase MuDR plant domain-containing protein n=1 Tax=Acer yangbiense TaxID=1000413 RepID=A0A5C7IJ88_9ROSI|nr:hypothetical protein EZV62_004064 [Acer yangbiense]
MEKSRVGPLLMVSMVLCLVVGQSTADSYSKCYEDCVVDCLFTIPGKSPDGCMRLCVGQCLGSFGSTLKVHEIDTRYFCNIGRATSVCAKLAAKENLADSDTEDEKPNEHDYPSSPDDTFVRVEQGAGVEDGIGGTKNCGGTGGVTFGGPSHDTFPAAPSRWILPCTGRYSFVTILSASNSQKGPLFVGQVFQHKHKLKTELGLYAMQERIDIRVRRSTKYRFEAGCEDINCQFTIGAVRKEHCMFWHVKKFIIEYSTSKSCLRMVYVTLTS